MTRMAEWLRRWTKIQWTNVPWVSTTPLLVVVTFVRLQTLQDILDKELIFQPLDVHYANEYVWINYSIKIHSNILFLNFYDQEWPEC